MAVAVVPPTPMIAEAKAPAIAARGICKSLDDRVVLRDITLEIPAGTFVSLLGANGAGKTTLLKILATLTRPDAGELRLFGEPAGDDVVSLRARIGLIGHQPMLYRDLSARENLVLFGRLYGLPDPATRAAELLETVGLSQRSEDPVKAFSRGMIQRVAIARALMHDPELILADEPFSGLDSPSSQTMERMLGMLHADGRTIVLVNHDIEQSLRLTQRVIVMRLGQVVLDQEVQTVDSAGILAEVCR